MSIHHFVHVKDLRCALHVTKCQFCLEETLLLPKLPKLPKLSTFASFILGNIGKLAHSAARLSKQIKKLR